jgi:hypothetical protein
MCNKLSCLPVFKVKSDFEGQVGVPSDVPDLQQKQLKPYGSTAKVPNTLGLNSLLLLSAGFGNFAACLRCVTKSFKSNPVLISLNLFLYWRMLARETLGG